MSPRPSSTSLALLLAAFPGPLSAHAPGLQEDAAPPEVVDVPPEPELEPLYQELFERVVDGDIGCLSVLAARDGEVLWLQGLGWADRERGRPASPDTAYMVGSVSKSLVGLAAPLLAADGQLDLEAPVADVLRSFEVATGDWIEGELTVADLARMTAGMPHGGFSWLRDPPATAREGSLRVVELFAVVDEEPGRTFRYSNYTSGVLAAVVRDVAGASFDRYLEGRVFTPLGMSATRALHDPADPDLARVHSGSFVFDVAPYSTPTAGQGMLSSARDLGRLAVLHLDPDRAEELGLPSGALAASRSAGERAGPGPGGYWMGWGRAEGEGVTFAMTNGQVFDATACMILCPERRAAAVCLTDTQWNAGRGGDRLADVVAMRVMDALVGDCTGTFTSQRRLHEGREPTPTPRETPLPPSPSRWSGSLRLAGKVHDCVLGFSGSGAATLECGPLVARATHLTRVEGRLEGSFVCEGELELLGEVGPLSRLDLRLASVGEGELGGSALLVANDADRAVIGSGGALVRLSLEEDGGTAR